MGNCACCNPAWSFDSGFSNVLYMVTAQGNRSQGFLADGTQSFTKLLARSPSGFQTSNGVAIYGDGTFLCFGYSGAGYLTKYTAGGDPIWTVSSVWGGTNQSIVSSPAIDIAGNAVCVGGKTSGSNIDPYLWVLDSTDGTLLKESRVLREVVPTATGDLGWWNCRCHANGDYYVSVVRTAASNQVENAIFRFDNDLVLQSGWPVYLQGPLVSTDADWSDYLALTYDFCGNQFDIDEAGNVYSTAYDLDDVLYFRSFDSSGSVRWSSAIDKDIRFTYRAACVENSYVVLGYRDGTTAYQELRVGSSGSISDTMSVTVSSQNAFNSAPVAYRKKDSTGSVVPGWMWGYNDSSSPQAEPYHLGISSAAIAGPGTPVYSFAPAFTSSTFALMDIDLRPGRIAMVGTT